MRIVLRIIFDNLRKFAVGAALSGGVFLAVIGGLSYVLAGGASSWRQMLVSILVFGLTALVAVLCGVRVAARETLRDWVDKMGVGPMLSKVIFKQALGVSDKRPQGSKEVASELAGLSLGEAKQLLSERLGDLFSSSALDRWLPQQGRWLAKKLTGGAGWLVTRSLLDNFSPSHFSLSGSDSQPIDLLALRETLSEGLHEKAISLVAARLTAFVAAAVVVAGVICLAAAALAGGI